MFWVIQQDTFIRNERPELLAVLERFDIPHQLVDVANWQVTPDVDYTGQIITNGSVMLSQIAQRRGWMPGGFLNANFSFDVWNAHLHDHLLNRDAIITTLANAIPHLPRVFVRPLADDKSFTGRVMSAGEFQTWRDASLQSKGLRPETVILMAQARPIGQEHRHFIVDGEVVSSSRYKLSQAVNYSAEVDGRVIDFARRMASLWQPARAFVLDTYLLGHEIGVVELGGICHAGFYAADVQKIVMALNAMPYPED